MHNSRFDSCFSSETSKDTAREKKELWKQKRNTTSKRAITQNCDVAAAVGQRMTNQSRFVLPGFPRIGLCCVRRVRVSRCFEKCAHTRNHRGNSPTAAVARRPYVSGVTSLACTQHIGTERALQYTYTQHRYYVHKCPSAAVRETRFRRRIRRGLASSLYMPLRGGDCSNWCQARSLTRGDFLELRSIASYMLPRSKYFFCRSRNNNSFGMCMHDNGKGSSRG